MSPEDAEAAHAEALAAPPLSPALRDYLNALFRPEIRAVSATLEEENRA